MNGKDIPHNVQTGLTSLWEYLSHPALAWSYHQVLDTFHGVCSAFMLRQ